MRRITIITDDQCQPLGGSIVWDYEGPGESCAALTVGPFDSLDEVWREAMDRLDIQLTLW